MICDTVDELTAVLGTRPAWAAASPPAAWADAGKGAV